MTWADISQVWGTGNKVSGSGFTTSAVLVDVEVANILVAYCTSDNIATTSGASSDHTAVTDSAGNTYTKLYEYTRSSGVAGDGVTISGWACKITALLTAGVSTATVTFSGTLSAKVFSGREFTVGAGKTWEEAGTRQTGNGSGTSTTSLTLNIGSAPTTSRVWLSHVGWEGPSSDTWTQDSDFFNMNGVGNNAGVADTNVTQRGGRDISGADTTKTHQGTNSISRDFVTVLFALDEVDEVGASPSDDDWLVGGGFFG